jgi:hypothetical protein
VSVAHVGRRRVSDAWRRGEVTTRTCHIVVEMLNRMTGRALGRAGQRSVTSYLPRRNWRENDVRLGHASNSATGRRSYTLVQWDNARILLDGGLKPHQGVHLLTRRQTGNFRARFEQLPREYDVPWALDSTT